jgi:hypothetical protein
MVSRGRRGAPGDAAEEEDLMARLWSPALAHRPRQWIQAAFPWGDPDTELAGRKEPHRWQIEVLEEVEEWLRTQFTLERMGLDPEIYYGSTSSGRGIGKSALYDGMLLVWFFSVFRGSTIIVTANNQDQLKTRTWAELGKWLGMAANGHWFSLDSEFLRPAPWYQEKLEGQLGINCGYHYAHGQLWDKDRPTAFAGVHNRRGMMILFEEATGIPDSIWNVAEGFLTDLVVPRMFLACSNPRTASGRFYETRNKERWKWHPRVIDARTVPGTDRKLLDGIIEKHGENSAEACAEVTGKDPDSSDKQFIARSLVDEAMARPVPQPYDHDAPIIIGVDVARQGDDQTVIQVRQGRDARSIPPVVLRGKDSVYVANRVAELIDMMNPDAVNVDVGMGAGVIDVLRARGYRVNEIDFGKAAEEPERWANRRTEMWGRGRSWLSGGCILANEDLKTDLVGPEYRFRGDNGIVALEPKDEMKKRGRASPDRADALMLTFAARVARRDISLARKMPGERKVRIADGVDYNPLKC